MVSARFILCERTRRSAGVWRHALAPQAVRVNETRSWAACREELMVSPASVVGMEVRAETVEQVVAALEQIGRRFPKALAVVLSRHELRSAEWLLREAGAAHVVHARRDVTSAARLVLRHLSRVPVPKSSFRERIWQRLPW